MAPSKAARAAPASAGGDPQKSERLPGASGHQDTSTAAELQAGSLALAPIIRIEGKASIVMKFGYAFLTRETANGNLEVIALSEEAIAIELAGLVTSNMALRARIAALEGEPKGG